MRIAIFSLYKNLDANPAVFSLLTLLVKDGFEVDFYSEGEAGGELLAFPNFHNISPRRDIKPEREKGFIRYEMGGWKSRLNAAACMAASTLDTRLMVASPGLVRLIDRRTRDRRYDCAIGVREAGIILARLSLPGSTPLIYYSLELIYEGHPSFGGIRSRKVKALEREIFPSLAAVLIQDEARARLLFQDNHQPYDPIKTLFFPVSYPGTGHVLRTVFFRQRFPEIATRKILLQIGGIHRSHQSDALLRLSAVCPQHLAIVFHGYVFPDLQPLAHRVGACLSQPDQPLERIDQVAGGADIGLVFYPADEENNRLIAHSSGQLSNLLRCGLPIITDGRTTLRELVESYHCGVVVNNVEEIFEAADRILDDYEAFSQAAVNCFNHEHDLKASYATLKTRIKTFVKPEE